MSRLSHSFSVEHAELYGVECAIVIHHLSFWIEQNHALNRNFHDGRTWMYQTQKEIAAVYSYLSEDTVRRTLKKLEEHEVIIKGNYNKTSFDRTVWYAFKNEEMFIIRRNRGMDSTKSPNQIGEIAEPIPYTKTHTKQKQQQASPDVVVTSHKNIYSCLEPLDIVIEVKVNLTHQYDEQRVKDGVEITEANKDKIITSYTAYLINACKKGLKLEKKENVEKINKDYAMKYDGLKQGKARVEAFTKHVEIIYEGYGNNVPFEYNTRGFKDKFKQALIKYNFTILEGD